MISNRHDVAMSNLDASVQTLRDGSAFRFFANTEPNLPASVVTRRINATVSVLALGLIAMEPWLFVWDEEYSGNGSSAEDLDDEHPSALRHLDHDESPRDAIGIRSISYSNPFEEVLLAAMAKVGAKGVAGFIETLGTIGLKRADMREQIKAQQIENVISDALIDYSMDKRIAEAAKVELEAEALRRQSRGDEVFLAMEIIEAQQAMSTKGIACPIWTLRQALDYIRGEENLVRDVHEIQDIGMTVSVIIDEPNSDG
jgi:hypothetical protein